jgi:hypothetical protein
MIEKENGDRNIADSVEQIVHEIKSLLGASPDLVLEAERCTDPEDARGVVVLFVVTNLGGSEEEDVRRVILEVLLQQFADPSLSKYRIRWGLDISPTN